MNIVVVLLLATASVTLGTPGYPAGDDGRYRDGGPGGSTYGAPVPTGGSRYSDSYGGPPAYGGGITPYGAPGMSYTGMYGPSYGATGYGPSYGATGYGGSGRYGGRRHRVHCKCRKTCKYNEWYAGRCSWCRYHYCRYRCCSWY